MTDNPPLTPVDAQALAQRGIEQPLHRERLSLVASGVGEYSSWELHDGPHPTDDDPHAVASSITITPHAADGHRPRWVGQVGTALAPDDIVDTVGISSNAGIGRPVPYGHIYARCRADVSAARFHFDDDTTTLIAAATSPTTGQRWIICELHNPASPSTSTSSTSTVTSSLTAPSKTPAAGEINCRRTRDLGLVESMMTAPSRGCLSSPPTVGLVSFHENRH